MRGYQTLAALTNPGHVTVTPPLLLGPLRPDPIIGSRSRARHSCVFDPTFLYPPPTLPGRCEVTNYPQTPRLNYISIRPVNSIITPDDILTGTRLKDRCQEIVDITLQTNRQVRKRYAMLHVLYGELWVNDISLMIGLIRIIYLKL